MNNDKKKKTIVLPLIFLVLFIGIFIFSAFKIVNYNIDTMKSKEIEKEISRVIIKDETKEFPTYRVDFESLNQIEQNSKAFVKVNGTDIKHIVVQGKDNEYYLSHDFNQKYSSLGCIFADYRNKLDGTDKNIIIYGHNMKNNMMFGTLKNVLTDEWYSNKENRIITFVTENANNLYEVFSVYEIEAEDYYITTFFEVGEFKKFVDTLKGRSKYKFNVDINENDQILTLSTCGKSNKDRIVLHAKKM